jgi:antitoxin VapB
MINPTVFIYKRVQAVRLPVELCLPNDIGQLNVRALGNERIIAPQNETWDSFFQHPLAVSDDFMETRTP